MQVTRVDNFNRITYNSTGPKQRVDHWEMTDDLKERLIAAAKEDVKAGVYMGQRFIDLQYNELEKVEPDRKGLMAKAMSLQRQNKTTEADYVRSGWGRWHNWSANMIGALFRGETIRADGPNMHIHDKHGRMIMSYNSKSGWVNATSTEEQNVYDSFKDVYYDAYKTAKAEMEKAQASEWRTRISGSTFDALF